MSDEILEKAGITKLRVGILVDNTVHYWTRNGRDWPGGGGGGL